MILQIYTAIHVLISLLAIATGLAVFYGLLTAPQPHRWTMFFLLTTLATSVTGFFFPFHGFTPAYAFGAISVVVLTVAIYALRNRRLAGGWRRAYVINALVALYLNVFVLVVQLFLKVSALKALTPPQPGPPSGPVFGAVQGTVLLVFLVLGTMATLRFRGETPAESLETNPS